MKKNFTLTIFLVFLLGFGIFPGSKLASQNVKDTMTLMPGNQYQTIEGFGGSLAFYSNWVTAHPNKQDMYELLFNDLSLDWLRLRNVYRYQDNFQPEAVEFVNKAKQLTPDSIKILMCSWTPPASLKSNNNLAAGTLAKENGEFVYGKFASYWKDALTNYHNLGIYPDMISIQNEPDWETEDWGTCRFEPTETNEYPGYNQALDSVYAKIAGMDHEPKLIGAEALGIGYNAFVNYNDPIKNKSYLDGYAYHLYHGGDDNDPDTYNENLQTITNYNDRPNHMTEYSLPDYDWMNTAWLINNVLTQANAATFFYWDAIWPENGLIDIDNPWDRGQWENDKGYTRNPYYYAIKHYSKHIMPGSKRIGVSGSHQDLRTACFLSPDSISMTAVVVNVSQNPVESVIQIDDRYFLSSNMFQSSNGNFYQDQGPVSTTREIVFPASSVTTIELTEFTNEPPVFMPEDIDILGSRDYILNGDSLQLNFAFTPVNTTNQHVSWSIISGNELASIDQNGLFVAKDLGEVVVQVMSDTNHAITDKDTLIISNSIPVKSINITGAEDINSNEGSVQLGIEFKPADATNQEVSWSLVSGSDLATISENGLLTALENGEVVVQAVSNADQSITDKDTIHISNQIVPVDSLSITRDSVWINTYQGKFQLNAKIIPEDATNQEVSWHIIEGTELARINESGLVSALANGEAKIKAISGFDSNIQDSIIIIISNQARITSIDLKGANNDTSITNPGDSLQIIAGITPENPDCPELKWEVSDTAIASINQNGLLIAKNNGIVKVFASALDSSGVCDSLIIHISNQDLGIIGLTKKIEIYPNPVKDQLFYQLNSYQPERIMVFDLSGRAYDVSYSDKIIDMKHLNDGIYLIKFICKKKVFVKRIVKK